LEAISDSYFPLSKSRDVSFEIGRLFMAMKDYGTAATYFVLSLRECGEHHVTHYNLGLCQHYIGQPERALQEFTRSVDLSPDYHEAREWQNRIRLTIAQQTAAATLRSPPPVHTASFSRQ
jgi:Tfp pilus assembly protein PilF